jgi:ABC-type nitrate/sulfonate/bicarbonate transport system substrate-binding protein
MTTARVETRAPRRARAAARAVAALRIGYVPLLDAAPLVWAREQGRKLGVHGPFALRREIGWASLRDRLMCGELDAAHAPAGLAMLLRLREPEAGFQAVRPLSLHGNAITLSRRIRASGVEDPHALRQLIRSERGRKWHFGIAAWFSSHHYMMRSWLQSGGIDPDRDVRLTVIPPPQMARNLALGCLDGFCAGEPWNTLACSRGWGWCAATSASVSPNHLEKVLVVRGDSLAARTNGWAAVADALREAGKACESRENTAELARMMAAERCLDVPPAVLESALGDAEHEGSRPVFHDRRELASDDHCARVAAELVACRLITDRDAAQAGLGDAFSCGAKQAKRA